MANPISFDGCFGWYHAGSADLGVVLCSPHGYEELCVHRHWREFAQKLSEHGLPTLRFDYPATGDSAGDDEIPHQVHAWVDSIRNAIRTLRAISGVERVALVGLRIGAMLATAAAELESELAALVLLAPIGSGESCFRELRALAMMRAPARRRSSTAGTNSGGLESAGFVYTPETIAGLRGLPQLLSGRVPAERVLLLNRPNVAADKEFHARLLACGVPVEEDVFQDYPLLIRNPELSAYPEYGFGRVVRWLSALRGEAQGHRLATPGPTVLRLPEADERPVFFNRSPDLFGVLCEPRDQTCGPALVFLNTGSNHHIGTSRMTVTMARRLAQLGFSSLRLDLAGLGDSDAPLDNTAKHRTNSTVVNDVEQALDWLEDKGYDAAVLIGLCSGATLALETTLRDKRVVGQILLNLPGFWEAADSRSKYVSRRAFFRHARRPLNWGRAARGQIDMWGIAKAVVGRSVEAAGHRIHQAWGELYGKDGRRNTRIGQFRRLAVRKVSTCFIYAEEDPGLDELEVLFGRDGARLCAIPNITLTVLSEGDHTFSWHHTRQQLFTAVERTLTAMRPNAVNQPTFVGTPVDSILPVET